MMSDPKRRLSFWLLMVLVGLGLLLRAYRLESNPPALNWDEVSLGYNAYSILQTGKDEWGFRLPLIFRAYGDFKLPLYSYFSVPVVAVLGLNAFSVRLISVLAGTGLIVLAYAITRQLTKSDRPALTAAFLTAVTPWGLFLSRVAVEANLAAFLFALGIYFLLLAWDREKRLLLFIAALAWGLALYAYNSARLLVPGLGLLIVCFALVKGKAKLLPVFLAVLLLFSLPLAWQLTDQSAQARYNLVSLLDEGAINRIIQQRESSKLPKVINRYLYNRPAYFVRQATENFLKNLSPQYLFVAGGSHYQFSLPHRELLYLVTAPFLLLGLLTAVVRDDSRLRFLLAWFLVALLPSAVTRDAPHVLRTLLVLPVPMILTAIGVDTLMRKLRDASLLKGRLVFLVLVLTVLLSLVRWWKDYWQVYPAGYSWAWQYGYQEVIDYVGSHYDQYDQIYLTKRYGEPHEFVLFYLKWDPGRYQNDRQRKWDYHAGWYWVDRFAKFIFVNDWEVAQNIKYQMTNDKNDQKLLLITSPGNYPEGLRKRETINFLNGQPAFEILDNDD